MPYVQNFSISQSPLNPALIIAENTSTGTDAAITQLRIYFQTTAGTYLVESGVTTTYNAWALANLSDEFDVLTSDFALSIKVDWLNVSNVVLYTKTVNYCLAFYNKGFMYYLTSNEAITPNIVQDTNYYNNKAKFWTSIVSAVNAVEYGDDIAASQKQLDVGTEMRLNQAKYF